MSQQLGDHHQLERFTGNVDGSNLGQKTSASGQLSPSSNLQGGATERRVHLEGLQGVAHRLALSVQRPKSQRLPSSVQQSSLGATEPAHGEPLETVSKHDEELHSSMPFTFVFSPVKHTLDFEVGLIPSCCPGSRVDHEST